MIENLGDMEIVSNTSSARQRASAHITALEHRVDDLEEENRNLKRELATKPSTITQAMYDKVCQKLQECYGDTIPF